MSRAAILRADALRLPLADESVDLVVTSPPYFALRSYRDMAWVIGPDGQMQPQQVHFAGQIGSEPTPQAFLEALWAVTAELWRVLKPCGSVFVNLGDKRSKSGGHNNASLTAPGNKHAKVARGHLDGGEVVDPGRRATRRNAPDRYNQAAFGRAKSKMLLPHRYAEGCEDGLADPCIKDHEHVGQHPAYTEAERCRGRGWVVRSDIVWSKPNGLPESVTDRVRDAHEYVFHLTKEGRYFAGVDEVREAYAPGTAARYAAGYSQRAADGERPSVNTKLGGDTYGENPRGKLPGSVWTIPSEPLRVPEDLGVTHFAAFPTALPLRCIRGWSPAGICTACGEGRRPVPAGGYVCACTPRVSRRGQRGDWRLDREVVPEKLADDWHQSGATVPRRPGGFGTKIPRSEGLWEYQIEGWTPPPTRPAVVLDPFGGTGTTAAVARALGRVGISVDLSADYCRLARWRIEESGDGERAAFGARPPKQVPGQVALEL